MHKADGDGRCQDRAALFVAEKVSRSGMRVVVARGAACLLELEQLQHLKSGGEVKAVGG